MKIGIIGLGNMGQALLRALASEYELFGYDRNLNKQDLARDLGVEIASVDELAKQADALIIAIKPKGVGELCQQIYKSLNKECVVISLAAGVGLSELEGFLNGHLRLALAMPNTPVAIKKGVTAVVAGAGLDEAGLGVVLEIFNSCGLAVEIDESQMGAFIGIAGSLPAYVFEMIDALASGAVACGMPRSKALEIASASVAGSASYAVREIKNGKHPCALRDAVASPAGTTIKALSELENKGFKASLIRAVKAAAGKLE